MATKKITGTMEIASNDYHEITWTGKTKDGKPIIIYMHKAINKDNIDWTMQDKDEIVAQATFEACYEEEDRDGSNGEPWELEYDDATAKAIALGYGVFAIDGVDVALCRGGGKFTVEREYRNIAADGDKGTVVGRVNIDSSIAKLQMSALEFINIIPKLYPALSES